MCTLYRHGKFANWKLNIKIFNLMSKKYMTGFNKKNSL